MKLLNRIFKKYTNKTVHQYITDKKINYAISLLNTNNYSIKEIGYTLGFENQTAFISFFKRHCGKSPGSYKTDMKIKE